MWLTEKRFPMDRKRIKNNCGTHKTDSSRVKRMHGKRTLFPCSFATRSVSLLSRENKQNKSTNEKNKQLKLFHNPEYKGKQSQKCIKGVQWWRWWWWWWHSTVVCFLFGPLRWTKCVTVNKWKGTLFPLFFSFFFSYFFQSVQRFYTLENINQFRENSYARRYVSVEYVCGCVYVGEKRK